MEDKLKIKISIAERLYPLTIKRSEEEGLRSASKKIEKLIKKLEENYAVRDKQDLLAMCALQFASQLENIGSKSIIADADIEKKLENLNQLISKNLV